MTPAQLSMLLEGIDRRRPEINMMLSAKLPGS